MYTHIYIYIYIMLMIVPLHGSRSLSNVCFLFVRTLLLSLRISVGLVFFPKSMFSPNACFHLALVFEWSLPRVAPPRPRSLGAREGCARRATPRAENKDKDNYDNNNNDHDNDNNNYHHHYNNENNSNMMMIIVIIESMMIIMIMDKSHRIC